MCVKKYIYIKNNYFKTKKILHVVPKRWQHDLLDEKQDPQDILCQEVEDLLALGMLTGQEVEWHPTCQDGSEAAVSADGSTWMIDHHPMQVVVYQQLSLRNVYYINDQ